MRYEKPQLIVLGSIAQNTFANFNPQGEGDKGAPSCDFCDGFGELSHSNVKPPGQGA